jgi:hypothetical protein
MPRRISGAVAEEAAGAPPCEGKSWAFGAKFRGEPHDCYQAHPPCMNCFADLGCRRCSGLIEELLCMKCHNWGHPAALEKHGKLGKTPTEKLRMQQGLKIIEGLVAKTKPVEAL